MSFTRITNSEMNTHGVRGLPDTPNLSAYDMQRKFDELSTDVLRPAIDRLMNELEDTSAASNIGVEVPEGFVSDPNLQSMLENMAQSNHSHANKEVLDKFSEDEENHLLYDGNSIASKSFASIQIGDAEIKAGIDDVLTFLEGENVTLEADEEKKSIRVSMSHDDERVFVRYSEYADGTNFVENPSSKTPYMGLAIVFEDTAPTEKESYHWILVGVENKDVPQFSINWETGELEYDGSTFTFYTDEKGYLHWGVI